MKRIGLSGLALWWLAGCSTPGPEMDGYVACTSPRPEMCTRQYDPACGHRDDGTRKTYGNACTACSDPEVHGYLPGACPQDPVTP